MPRKPGPSQIAAAEPLSALAARLADPLAACNVCGEPAVELAAWREHDERDVPVDGAGALVFIARDHPECVRAMERHPRLYSEEAGRPGTFPRLCGDCPRRTGRACSHPNLRANGGAGLFVELDDRLRGAILCGGRGRRIRPVNHALACEGHPTKVAVRSIP